MTQDDAVRPGPARDRANRNPNCGLREFLGLRQVHSSAQSTARFGQGRHTSVHEGHATTSVVSVLSVRSPSPTQAAKRRNVQSLCVQSRCANRKSQIADRSGPVGQYDSFGSRSARGRPLAGLTLAGNGTSRMTVDQLISRVFPQFFPAHWLEHPGMTLTPFPSHIRIGYVRRQQAGAQRARGGTEPLRPRSIALPTTAHRAAGYHVR